MLSTVFSMLLVGSSMAADSTASCASNASNSALHLISHRLVEEHAVK
jgi:hypothetical protein